LRPSMILLLVPIFFLAAYIYFLINSNKYYGLPNGPVRYPIFGNLISIIRNPPGEDVFLQWREKYGNVYTFWSGAMPMVLVTDYKTIIDTFQADADSYAGRYSFTEMTKLVRGGPYGLIMTEGEHWVEQRKFVAHFLSDLGIGKRSLQERYLNEVQRICKRIDDQLVTDLKKEHDIYEHCELSAGSLINSLLFGYSFEGDREHEFHDVVTRFREHSRAIFNPIMLIAMNNPTFFMKLPFFGYYIKVVIKTGHYLLNFFRNRVHERMAEFDENEENHTELVHAFMREWRLKDERKEKHYFSEDQLVCLCYDLWFAGHESAATTLGWGFAFLINHPEIQVKCHSELDKVIGSDRLITMSDRTSLSYCHAIVCEVQRLANIVSQNVWHKTLNDVCIEGHKIKKGTTIIPQISVILTDGKIFKDPKVFRPERFIDPESGKFKPIEELIQFSIGKRRCLGDYLAEMELFLTLANVLNRYKLLPGKEKPNMKRNFGAAVNINRYTCKIEKRL